MCALVAGGACEDRHVLNHAEYLGRLRGKIGRISKFEGKGKGRLTGTLTF